MSRRDAALDRAFQDCLEAIAGGASREEALAAHPELAEQLRGLMWAADGIATLPGLPTDAREAMRLELEQLARAARSGTEGIGPSSAAPDGGLGTGGGWPLLVAAAMAVGAAAAGYGLLREGPGGPVGGLLPVPGGTPTVAVVAEAGGEGEAEREPREGSGPTLEAAAGAREMGDAEEAASRDLQQVEGQQGDETSHELEADQQGEGDSGVADGPFSTPADRSASSPGAEAASTATRRSLDPDGSARAGEDDRAGDDADAGDRSRTPRSTAEAGDRAEEAGGPDVSAPVAAGPTSASPSGARTPAPGGAAESRTAPDRPPPTPSRATAQPLPPGVREERGFTGLSGRVEDEAGRPAEEAVVLAYREDGAGPWLIDVNDEGAWRLDLPAGAYRLRILVSGQEMGWYEGARTRAEATPIEVRPGYAWVGLSLRSEPAP